MVIGVDPHKQTHTAVAVSGVGEVLGERTVKARPEGHEQLLRFARGLGSERTFALEDCRHVSGALERFLIARGERVVRVPPRLMGQSRRTEREAGKSDAVDALAVARAALRQPDLPQARLQGPEREIALLLDHRDDVVAENTRDMNRLRWHLHDTDPRLEPPLRALSSDLQLRRLERRLGRRSQSVQVQVARQLVGQIRRRLRHSRELERELGRRIEDHAPELSQLRGCGALTAAKIVSEVAGVERFASEAKLAKYAGIAPLDASSGQQRRHRLNRKGNRQLNRALHTIAVTQARIHPEAKAFLDRKRSEGKGRREALRSLKRQLVRVVYRILKSIKIKHTTRRPEWPPKQEGNVQTTVYAGVPLGTPCLT